MESQNTVTVCLKDSQTKETRKSFVNLFCNKNCVIFWPYNKPFIDQACSVKMAGYWPSCFFFFCVLVNNTYNILSRVTPLDQFPFVSPRWRKFIASGRIACHLNGRLSRALAYFSGSTRKPDFPLSNQCLLS